MIEEARTKDEKVSRFELILGGWGDPIVKQLGAQGIKLPGHCTRSLERSRLAIIQLRAANCLTLGQAESARARLLKAVAQALTRYRGGEWSVKRVY